jgi:AcrR family transcriptional regulator
LVKEYIELQICRGYDLAMDGERIGLRERKKLRTRQVISDAALRLFLARGFDAVSVADVAAAAEVSKPTLFRYFRTKEELVIDRVSDHREESARVVRGRRDGEPPLDALHRHQLELLADRDPITGLCDHPDSIALREMIYGVPSLGAHLIAFATRSAEALAEALVEAGPPGADALTARLAAVQIACVLQVLAEDNWRRLTAGRSADELYPAAVAAADRAFALLRDGLGAAYG